MRLMMIEARVVLGDEGRTPLTVSWDAHAPSPPLEPVGPAPRSGVRPPCPPAPSPIRKVVSVVDRSRQRLKALLNVHSYYSLVAGTASPTTLVRRAAELGYEYLALTDDLNVTGAVELFQAAREHGLRPLIGATVPVRVEHEAYPFV